jgi:hypothetical protein
MRCKPATDEWFALYLCRSKTTIDFDLPFGSMIMFVRSSSSQLMIDGQLKYCVCTANRDLYCSVSVRTLVLFVVCVRSITIDDDDDDDDDDDIRLPPPPPPPPQGDACPLIVSDSECTARANCCHRRSDAAIVRLDSFRMLSKIHVWVRASRLLTGPICLDKSNALCAMTMILGATDEHGNPRMLAFDDRRLHVVSC